MIAKTTQFRQLLLPDRLEFLMEAHDGLSARIVQEAGFPGIWASGLCMSATLGVRDNNEASWTQVLDLVEFMSDASGIPILLDADTGYGNFNNVRRLVRKLEQRQVAAMCIEDKLFPKTNSFIKGEAQPLADIDEFTGKLKAAKDSQQDPDFCVVARIEALIAGWGMAEALRRAEAYWQAGADALLIHSKATTADQVLEFLRQWQAACPVILVPTTYYDTPTEQFEQAGASLVIWANQLLRASITAMQRTSAEIHRNRSIASVEGRIASVKEVFRLQEAAELEQAERRYLPDRPDQPKALLLPTVALRQAGGRSNGRSNGHAPAPLDGQPLLHWQMTGLQQAGITETVVAATSLPAPIDVPGIKLHCCPVPPETGELVALAGVRQHLTGPALLCRDAILVQPHILVRLQQEPGDIVVVIDAETDKRQGGAGWRNFDHRVRCTAANSRDYFATPPRLMEFTPEEPHGQWIGLLKLSGQGTRLLKQALGQLEQTANFQQLDLRDLLVHLTRCEVPVDVMYIHGQWFHADDAHARRPPAKIMHAAQ